MFTFHVHVDAHSPTTETQLPADVFLPSASCVVRSLDTFTSPGHDGAYTEREMLSFILFIQQASSFFTLSFVLVLWSSGSTHFLCSRWRLMAQSFCAQE